MTVAARRDATGAVVAVPSRPARIVSLVPSITELLFDLDLDARIVGVTRFCTEPPAGVARKARVGREKDPDLDKIRALGPDLVVANMEENRREVVETLRAEGVPVWVTFPRTVADGIALIRELAELTGVAEAGAALAAALDARYRAAVARLGGHRPARVFCPIWREPWMTIGRDTYVHDMLRLCGGDNVFAASPGRYPTVTLEAVRAARPDVILLPDEPYRFRRAHLADFAPFPEIPAVRDGRVRLVDGRLLTWYGARIGQALERLPDLLRC